ncbi:MAG: hypothetical protein ACI4T9_03270 [Prevotella sp.]
MKKVVLLFSLVFCLLSVDACNTVKPTASDSLVASSLKRLSTASPADFPAVYGELSRIADMYPNDWLPLYYQTFLSIQGSLFTHNENSKMLEPCLQQIEKMQQLKGADLSEVYALKAYYYYVLIALNAKKNGPTYYSQVFGLCEKALKINPKNPRAMAISFVFKKQMGAFLKAQPEGDDTKKMQAISALFDQEKKDNILPHWGKEILSYISRK